jgi:hypothetical protein
MNYTKEKIDEKFYKIKVIINDVEHIFNCIVTNDTESELDEIVQWNIDNMNVEPMIVEPSYADKRKAEYPSIIDYIDGIVKGDQAQIDAYILSCKAVKEKYPKN